jgi:hypothetical protein
VRIDPFRIPLSASAHDEIPPPDPHAVQRSRYAVEQSIQHKFRDEGLNVRQFGRAIRLEEFSAGRNLQERRSRSSGDRHPHFSHVVKNASQTSRCVAQQQGVAGTGVWFRPTVHDRRERGIVTPDSVQ